MDAKLLAKISLRVLAVFLVGLGFWLLPDYFMVAYNSIPPNSFKGDTASWLQIIFNPAVYGLIIWFLAPRLAKLAVGKEAVDAPAPADPAAWQTAGLTVLGVYFIVQNAPLILGLVIEFQGNGPGTSTWVEGSMTSLADHLTVAAARLLLGIVLVFGAGFFVQLFRRFREFGLQKQ